MAQNKYSDGNGVVAEILAQEFRMMIGDRAFIGNHPVLDFGYLGNQLPLGANKNSATTGSEGISAGLGELTATAAEDTEVTPSAFTFDKLTCTVARNSAARGITDMLATFVNGGQLERPDIFVADALGIWQNTLMSRVATVGASFTATAGSTGVNLTLEDLLDAKTVLTGADNDMSSILCFLHPSQFADVEKDLFNSNSRTHAIENSPEAYNIQYPKSVGYQGTFFGIDFFTSSRVPTANAGADRAGFMATRQSLAWNTGKVIAKPHRDQIIIGSNLIEVAFDHKPGSMSENVYYNAILGASKGIDTAGIAIVSDA